MTHVAWRGEPVSLEVCSHYSGADLYISSSAYNGWSCLPALTRRKRELMACFLISLLCLCYYTLKILLGFFFFFFIVYTFVGRFFFPIPSLSFSFFFLGLGVSTAIFSNAIFGRFRKVFFFILYHATYITFGVPSKWYTMVSLMSQSRMNEPFIASHLQHTPRANKRGRE